MHYQQTEWDISKEIYRYEIYSALAGIFLCAIRREKCCCVCFHPSLSYVHLLPCAFIFSFSPSEFVLRHLLPQHLLSLFPFSKWESIWMRKASHPLWHWSSAHTPKRWEAHWIFQNIRSASVLLGELHGDPPHDAINTYRKMHLWHA